MREFERYHPIVNFIYFLAQIAFSVVFMHPICIAISVFCGICYSIMLKGRRAAMFSAFYMLPLFVLTAILNPVFNHAGITILTYLPGGNPLTLESLIYGLCAAGMLVAVISWFSCFGEIVSGDKFIYLFGKILPSIALVLSMAFRFVPKFGRDIKGISDAQKGIGKKEEKTFKEKAKAGVGILSIMITKSLENAADTALSMKSRGYGSGKRSSFSNYRFTSRDTAALGVIMLLFAVVLLKAVFSEIPAEFFPKMKFCPITRENAAFFIAYFALSLLPIIIEIREALRWKRLRSKI